MKYIDVLGRKGCCRTALEYCKLLLGLNAKVDFYGVLLRIDYYTIRAKSYDFLLNFMHQFPQETYDFNDETKISCVKLLPNLLMSSALALKNTKQEESKHHNEDLERKVVQLKTAIDSG